MNIVVEVKATELADAINNLAVALGDMMAARNEMKADVAADKVVAKAKKKAQSEVADNTDSTGSGQSSANVSATVAEVTPPLPTVDAATAPQSEAGAPPAITFDQVKKVFLALAGKQREVAVKILADHGCAKLTDAKPEQFGDIYALIEKAQA